MRAGWSSEINQQRRRTQLRSDFIQNEKRTTGIPFKLYYRPDELAKAADLSIWTVYRMIKKDKIRHSRIGHSIRIPRDEFIRVLNGEPQKLPSFA
jgi:excisionase family DNA binding protein